MFAQIQNITQSSKILSSPIEYLKGVGPQKADLLKKELGIHTFRDLLEHFPYRHVDKTTVTRIAEIHPGTEYVQVRGRLLSLEMMGENRGKRLVAQMRDETGILELVWFQGVNGIQKMLVTGQVYLVFGKVSFFQSKPQITHPELETYTEATNGRNFLEPVYPSTEKLKTRGLGGRQIAKLVHALFTMIREQDLPEILPAPTLEKLGFLSRFQAFSFIHFPPDQASYEKALDRLKFDEFFIAQVRLGMIRSQRHRASRGVLFGQVGEYFNDFYNSHLPFELTGAQKRVIKEIRKDTGTGRQMNRLLQGDVGSGKTIVALLTMLIAADNGFQSVLVAPTEILSQQHFNGLQKLLKNMPVQIRLLTGSTKTAARKVLHKELAEGTISILVGTHAVLEDVVKFKNLGLVIIDEQHRFGVAQRAKLWSKAVIPPHVLVMTATPIPRTLAMTAYGDLDYSIIDELPPGRKPIITVHRSEKVRSQVMTFIKSEIKMGRQAYIVFPLIEESEKLDYENLMKGYENVKAYFPEPKYYISMVHGRQPNDQK
ncbi:MAG: ATP-dependent DNA helicase RecG, partial [Flavitalea sp.]